MYIVGEVWGSFFLIMFIFLMKWKVRLFVKNEDGEGDVEGFRREKIILDIYLDKF